jgi:hypothetical protein
MLWDTVRPGLSVAWRSPPWRGAALAMLACAARAAGARSFGVDVGLAAAREYGAPTATVGASVLVPLGPRVGVNIAFVQCAGASSVREGFTRSPGGPSDVVYAGNNGFLLSGVTPVVATERTPLLFGDGIGLFRQLRETLRGRHVDYIEAPTYTVIVEHRAAPRLTLYTRGDLGLRPSWTAR